MTFQVSNRPTSLNVDYHYLVRIVSQYLGYGLTPAELDDEQAQAVDEVIDQGCRLYYYPPAIPSPLGNGMVAHEWSFMRPIFEFKTVANQRRYPLPSTWERQIGNLSNADGDTTYPVIQFTSPSRLRTLENHEEFTSYPRFAAVEPAQSSGESPQQQVLALHPTPDAEYTFRVQFQACGRKLSATQPHPLGGQIHSDGILAAVLAAAEMRAGEEGLMYKRFIERLSSNIARDENRGASILGYNHNGGQSSPGRGTIRRFNGLFYERVTYGGTDWFGE